MNPAQPEKFRTCPRVRNFLLVIHRYSWAHTDFVFMYMSMPSRPNS